MRTMDIESTPGTPKDQPPDQAYIPIDFPCNVIVVGRPIEEAIDAGFPGECPICDAPLTSVVFADNDYRADFDCGTGIDWKGGHAHIATACRPGARRWRP